MSQRVSGVGAGMLERCLCLFPRAFKRPLEKRRDETRKRGREIEKNQTPLHPLSGPCVGGPNLGGVRPRLGEEGDKGQVRAVESGRLEDEEEEARSQEGGEEAELYGQGAKEEERERATTVGFERGAGRLVGQR